MRATSFLPRSGAVNSCNWSATKVGLPPCIFCLHHPPFPEYQVLVCVSTRQILIPPDKYEIQCVQSSLSQNGGADLRSPCSGKFLKALKWWLKLPQLFPEIFGFAQRPIWWVAGRERQSPPSSLASRRATEGHSALAIVFAWLTTTIFPDFCKIIFLPRLDQLFILKRVC